MRCPRRNVLKASWPLVVTPLAGCSLRDESETATVGLRLRNFAEVQREIQVTVWEHDGERRDLLASTSFHLDPEGEKGAEERSDAFFESVPSVIDAAIVSEDKPIERHHHFYPSCPDGEHEVVEIRTWTDEVRFRQVCES